MSSFTYVNQKITTASAGQQLVDIVDYTASVGSDGVFGWSVQLRDLTSGQIVAFFIYGPTLGVTDSGSLPLAAAPVTMGTTTMRLRLELVVNFPFNIPTVVSTVTLNPIYLPGTAPPPTIIPPDQVPLAVGLAGVAIASIAGLAYMRYRRKRRRR